MHFVIPLSDTFITNRSTGGKVRRREVRSTRTSGRARVRSVRPNYRCCRGQRGVSSRGQRGVSSQGQRGVSRGVRQRVDEAGMKKLTDTDSTPVVFMPRDAVGTKNLPANNSALDHFLLFFDNETIDKLCIHSNSYAELY